MDSLKFMVAIQVFQIAGNLYFDLQVQILSAVQILSISSLIGSVHSF